MRCEDCAHTIRGMYASAMGSIACMRNALSHHWSAYVGHKEIIRTVRSARASLTRCIRAKGAFLHTELFVMTVVLRVLRRMCSVLALNVFEWILDGFPPNMQIYTILCPARRNSHDYMREDITRIRRHNAHLVYDRAL